MAPLRRTPKTGFPTLRPAPPTGVFAPWALPVPMSILCISPAAPRRAAATRRRKSRRARAKQLAEPALRNCRFERARLHRLGKELAALKGHDFSHAVARQMNRALAPG